MVERIRKKFEHPVHKGCNKHFRHVFYVYDDGQIDPVDWRSETINNEDSRCGSYHLEILTLCEDCIIRCGIKW